MGNIFFGKDKGEAGYADAKALLEGFVKRSGLSVVGWRPVPTDNSMLGKDPLDSEPHIEQVFVLNDGGKKGKKLDPKKVRRTTKSRMYVRKLG